MVLEAESTVMAPHVDTEDHTEDHEWLEEDDEEEVPELHSESESSDSDSDSDGEGHDDVQDLQQHRADAKDSWEAYRQTRKQQAQERETSPTTQGENAVTPPMLVRPQVTSEGAVHIALAVSNEHGTEPMIIWRGQVMATVRRVPESSIKHSKCMQWSPTPDRQH